MDGVEKGHIEAPNGLSECILGDVHEDYLFAKAWMGRHTTGWHNMGWYNTGWHNTGWYNMGWHNTGWHMSCLAQVWKLKLPPVRMIRAPCLCRLGFEMRLDS